MDNLSIQRSLGAFMKYYYPACTGFSNDQPDSLFCKIQQPFPMIGPVKGNWPILQHQPSQFKPAIQQRRRIMLRPKRSHAVDQRILRTSTRTMTITPTVTPYRTSTMQPPLEPHTWEVDQVLVQINKQWRRRLLLVYQPSPIGFVCKWSVRSFKF
jgi:hypothetical protein